MTHDIISRVRIAQQAQEAAQASWQTNPYDPDTEAHALWRISCERATTAEVEDAESSA